METHQNGSESTRSGPSGKGALVGERGGPSDSALQPGTLTVPSGGKPDAQVGRCRIVFGRKKVSEIRTKLYLSYTLSAFFFTATFTVSFWPDMNF